jgi:hypothetical protein
MDVYEWEREGTGSCPIGSGSGCVYLISSGKSPDPSYFAEASANGNDVFFFTRQPLVGQDKDELVDVYDARVDGGIASQNPPPPSAPCLSEESCHAAYSQTSTLGTPASQVFSGPGNPVPAPEAGPRVKPVTPPKPKSSTRAEQLANALKGCRGKHDRRKRAACEHQARSKYAAHKAADSGRGGR